MWKVGAPDYDKHTLPALTTLSSLRIMSLYRKNMGGQYVADMAAIRGSFKHAARLVKEPYFDFDYDDEFDGCFTLYFTKYQFPVYRFWLRHAMKSFDQAISSHVSSELQAEISLGKHGDPLNLFNPSLITRLFRLISLANTTLLVACFGSFSEAAEEILDICLSLNKYLSAEAIKAHLYRLILIVNLMKSEAFLRHFVLRVESSYGFSYHVWETMMKVLNGTQLGLVSPNSQCLLPRLDTFFPPPDSGPIQDPLLLSYTGPTTEIALMKWFNKKNGTFMNRSPWAAIVFARSSIHRHEVSKMLFDCLGRVKGGFAFCPDNALSYRAGERTYYDEWIVLNIIETIWDASCDE